MPKNIYWKRLGRHPKHRWSMLRNMAASLFDNERIVTTQPKAKALLPLVNIIFSRSLHKDMQSRNKLFYWIRQPRIVNKLYYDISDRLRGYNGGIANMTPVFKKRKGDRAQMATVQLIEK